MGSHKEKQDPSLVLAHRYKHRITVAKQGKMAMNAHDYSTALSRYLEYVRILSDYRSLNDHYELRPTHFDQTKEARELLLMSHIYFEMARVYDSSPRFKQQTQKCLDQFVRFTLNQPYQAINSELLRKFMRKTAFKNPELFRAAYEKIFVQSKKCYIVTFCFGEEHEVTKQFRKFKSLLLASSLGPSIGSSIGIEIVRLYYLFSSKMVDKQSPLIRMISQFFIKPILLTFSKTVLRIIIR